MHAELISLLLALRLRVKASSESSGEMKKVRRELGVMVSYMDVGLLTSDQVGRVQPPKSSRTKPKPF